MRLLFLLLLLSIPGCRDRNPKVDRGSINEPEKQCEREDGAQERGGYEVWHFALLFSPGVIVKSFYLF